MKRTSVVGTRRMATPTRQRQTGRWRWSVTLIVVVGVGATGIAAWKTVGYAMQLHDPLTAVSVVVLALVCLAAGLWGLDGAWRTER